VAVVDQLVPQCEHRGAVEQQRRRRGLGEVRSALGRLKLLQLAAQPGSLAQRGRVLAVLGGGDPETQPAPGGARDVEPRDLHEQAHGAVVAESSSATSGLLRMALLDADVVRFLGVVGVRVSRCVGGFGVAVVVRATPRREEHGAVGGVIGEVPGRDVPEGWPKLKTAF